jgi:hypothetical protein
LLKSLEKYQNELDGVLALNEEDANQLSELLDKCRG